MTAHEEKPMTVDTRVSAGDIAGEVSHVRRRAACFSARAGGWWNLQVAADLAGERPGDLVVAGDHRGSVGGAAPLLVLGAANETAAVLAQVRFQGTALHGWAVKISASRSSRPAGSVSASSGVSIVCSASITFSRACARVWPWLWAPGTSGIDATIQPSPPSS